MLQRIARLAIAAPRRIIGFAVFVFIAAAVFGVPVADSLSPGGFQDPRSESARAIEVLTDKFGQSGQKMLIVVTAAAGADSPPAREVGTDIVEVLRRSPLVYNVTSPWTVPPTAAADLLSTDGKSGLIVVNVKGGENDAQNHAQTLSDEVAHDRDGVTVRAGGSAMEYAQINRQNKDDLLVMELIAIPLSFLVLIWVFGGLLAAGLPMAQAVLAVVGSMAVLRLVTFATEVSTFALNLSTALGLALAIDYTLLIVSRYRDELAEGSDRDEALIRTMATSGRTVLFSAVTVALSMSATALFRGYRGIRRDRVDRDHPGRDCVARSSARCVGRAPTGASAAGPARSGAQTGQATVLVPVEQVRDAPLAAGRYGCCRAAGAARAAVLVGEVGFPGRPGVAAVGVGPSSRRYLAR